jgi:hypothetical protein
VCGAKGDSRIFVPPRYGVRAAGQFIAGGKRPSFSSQYIIIARHICLAWFREIAVFACTLAWERAGMRMAIIRVINGTRTIQIAETTTPAMASPWPFSCSALFLIAQRPTMPRINPKIAVSPQVKIPQMPRTKLAIARPEVFAEGNGSATDLTLFILRSPKK